MEDPFLPIKADVGGLLVFTMAVSNYNTEYDDVYFSNDGGPGQSREVFVGPNALVARTLGGYSPEGAGAVPALGGASLPEAQLPTGGLVGPLQVGELGFGSGLNLVVFLAELMLAQGVQRPGEDARPILATGSGETGGLAVPTALWHGVDRDPLDPVRRRALLEPVLAAVGDRAWGRALEEGLRLLEVSEEVAGSWGAPGVREPSVCLAGTMEGGGPLRSGDILLPGGAMVGWRVWVGDVGTWEAALPARIDAWVLDGHDPERNPAMWSPAIFALMARHSLSGTTFGTWCAKGTVKAGLREVGFAVRRRPGYGRKRHRIEGVFEGSPEGQRGG